VIGSGTRIGMSESSRACVVVHGRGTEFDKPRAIAQDVALAAWIHVTG